MRLLKSFRDLFRADAHDVPTEAPSAPEAEADVSLQHVWTDLPNAIRLQASRLFTPMGARREYARGEDAADAPLARALLDMAGVEAVVLEGPYITVTLDEQADWDPLMVGIPRAITKFLNAGGQAVQDAPGKKKFSFGFRQVSSRPREEQFKLVQHLFEEEINPAVAAHGGHFSLIDVKDDTVYVQLGGGCQGCGMANVTLRQGVEQRLKEVLPEMVALVDVTDHAAGTNPYYQASKK